MFVLARRQLPNENGDGWRGTDDKGDLGDASTLKDLETIGRSARRAVGQFLREVRGYRLDTLITADPAFAPSEATTRINLILLGSGSRGLFGGTATAIRFLSAMEPLFARSRVVVIGENEAAFEPRVWPNRDLKSQSPSSLRTIVYGPSSKLVVGPGDRFIATHWRTAYYLSTLREAQAERAIKSATAAYLVQDFEPGFYPWGSNYLLADSTYRQDNRRSRYSIANYFGNIFTKGAIASPGNTYLSLG